MSKYSEIRTADELQAALSEVRRSLKSEGENISRTYGRMKAHYTPARMVMGFLKRKSDYFNWADLSLSLIRTVRKRINGISCPPPASQDKNCSVQR